MDLLNLNPYSPEDMNKLMEEFGPIKADTNHKRILGGLALSTWIIGGIFLLLSFPTGFLFFLFVGVLSLVASACYATGWLLTPKGLIG